MANSEAHSQVSSLGRQRVRPGTLNDPTANKRY